MGNKTKFNKVPFKLQVYVDKEMVSEIDQICKKTNVYRSGFVTEAIERLLKMAKYRKILGGK